MNKNKPDLFYVKPTGSTCYAKDGVTFPKRIEFDLVAMVQIAANNPYVFFWERQYGYSNLPKVLVFSGDDIAAKRVNEILELYAPNCFVVAAYWN